MRYLLISLMACGLMAFDNQTIQLAKYWLTWDIPPLTVPASQRHVEWDVMRINCLGCHRYDVAVINVKEPRFQIKASTFLCTPKSAGLFFMVRARNAVGNYSNWSDYLAVKFEE